MAVFKKKYGDVGWLSNYNFTNWQHIICSTSGVDLFIHHFIVLHVCSKESKKKKIQKCF